MNRMVVVLFAMLVLAASLGGCAAKRQSDLPIPPMSEVEAMTDLVAYELKLSPEQRTKVRGIVEENQEMKQRIRQQYRGRPVEYRDAQRSRLEKFERQVQALLTEEQRDLFGPLYRSIRNQELSEDDDRWRQQDPNMYQPGNQYGY